MAMITMPFIARSTGMTSPVMFSSHIIDLMTPFAPPTKMPIGPFKLSTQPGSGSSNDGVTKNE